MDDFYMDETLHHGHPRAEAGRTPQELACYDLLDKLGIVYDRVDHSAAGTIEMCEAVERVLGEKICKNLFLCNRQRTQFYLLMLEGEKVFKTKDLSRQLGVSRLSFAGTEDMAQYLGVAPGSVTVLGLMHDRENCVQLVMDRPIAAAARVGCHPCVNTSSLCLSMDDLLHRFLPAVHHEPVLVDLPEEDTL